MLFHTSIQDLRDALRTKRHSLEHHFPHILCRCCSAPGHPRSPGVGLLGLKMIPSIWIRMAMVLTVFNHRTTQRTTIQKDRTMHVQDGINLDDVCPMISRFSTLQSILGLQWCKKAPRHQVQMPSTQRIQSLQARGPGSGLMSPWMVPKNSLKNRGLPWFTQQTYGWNFHGEWWGSYEGDGYPVIKHGQLRNPMTWGIRRVLMGKSSIQGGVSSKPCLIVGGQWTVITSCHRFFGDVMHRRGPGSVVCLVMFRPDYYKTPLKQYLYPL